MQNDDVIWTNIKNGFCSYKAKIESNTFCRNEYNVTGLCNRTSCPLANSKYATIIEKDGICYLYMKEVERAHTPAKLWEKVKLSKNYLEAMQQIDSHLEYWPKILVHKVKQRFTKIKQYLIRMRKLKKRVAGKKLVGVKPREEKREKARETKALRIAEIEKKIKSELLDRLKKGIYDKEGIVNLGHFKEVLEEEGISDYEEGEEEEEEEGIEEFVEDVSDIEDFNLELEDAQFNNFEDDLEESDDEEEEDDDDESDGEDDEGESPANKKRPRDGAAPTQKPKVRKGRKGASMRIEYEEEDGATKDLSLDW